MKKLLSLILALVFVCTSFALVSCNPDDPSSLERLAGKTPEELYSMHLESFENITSVSLTGIQKISMTSPGVSINMLQTVEAKMNNENIYFKMENNLASEVNMEMWYIDGTVYMSVAEEKMKLEVGREEFIENYLDSDPTEDALVDIPKSWFDNMEFVREEDSWVLAFVIGAEDFIEYFGDPDFDGEIKGNVNYKLYFDSDGNLEKQYTELDMDVEGYTVHIESTATITVGDATVTPPEDADSYLSTVDPDQF